VVDAKEDIRQQEDTINGVEVNKTMEKEKSEGATPLEVDQQREAAEAD
jgi:hypothetical protein